MSYCSPPTFGQGRRALSETGFVVSRGHSEHDVLSIARTLGTPVAEPRDGVLVKPLRPVTSSDAPTKTLSAHYGQGAFPLHTEAAYWPSPPRFMILFCVTPGDGEQPTLLLDANPLRLDRSLMTTPWLVSSGLHPFLATVVDVTSGKASIRFDGDCMRPVTAAGRVASAAVTRFIGSAEPDRHAWQAGDLLIVDNHRMLHGRGAPVGKTSGRLLLKVMVSEDHP